MPNREFPPGKGISAREGSSAKPDLAKRSFVFSVSLHAVLALAIVAAGLFSIRSRRAEPKDVMVEFTVAIPPQDEESVPEETPQETAPEPPPPEPPKAVPEKPKFEKGKIVHRDPPKPQRNIVEKPKKETPPKRQVVKNNVEVKGKKLSEEEIRKLLDAGARPSDHTSIPTSERERCIALIYNAIKRAWICPDSSALSASEPEIEFSLGTGGALGNVRLVRSSGNDLLDRSVLEAARAVRTVSGLTPGFIRENPRLTVAFSLKEGV